MASHSTVRPHRLAAAAARSPAVGRRTVPLPQLPPPRTATSAAASTSGADVSGRPTPRIWGGISATRRLRDPQPPAAMFDSLAVGLEKAWDSVRKDGKLTADNIKTPMREIRRALLEADVSLPVVRQFVARVEEKALGVKVIKGVKPDQQLVKVVYDELKDLMGGEAADLVVPPPGSGPRVILMAGLQGVGKTTACGKLAKHLQGRGQSVMMVATDVYRPAAIDQLVSLGKRVNVPVFEMGTAAKPADIAAKGLEKARAEGVEAVIVDTAGRLQIDESMMAELKDVAAAVNPTDTLLVVDAMTGQEAAALAAAFGAAAPLTGVVLTKMDGDARGGAALSVRAVSGKPIKFVGTGEKLDALEQFYPDRLAGRILGMGDVLSLVEKAEAAIAEKDAEAMTKRMLAAKFDFNDFLKQYEAVTGMGGMGALMKMLPGMASITDKQLAAAEAQFKVYKSMIDSMTPGERADPDLLARVPSRRRRVARGSGRSETDVAGLLATFAGMRSRMRSLSSMLTGGGAGAPPGMLSNEELMEATVNTAAAGVPPGKVRRRKPKRAAVSRGGGGFGGGGGKAKVAAAKAA